MGLDRMKDVSLMGSEHIRKIQTTSRRDAGTVLTTGWKTAHGVTTGSYQWLWSVLLPRLLLGSAQFSSVTQSCLTLSDRMDRITPGLLIHHQLPEFTQTHIH